MDIFNRQTLIRIAIFAAILLFAWELWEPVFNPVLKTAPNTPPSPAKQKSRLDLNFAKAFDRKGFLQKFEHQSGASLMPCLRSTLGERGSVHFMARLSKRGKLSAVRIIHNNRSVTDCAKHAVEEMEFESVAKSLGDESLELSWGFEW